MNGLAMITDLTARYQMALRTWFPQALPTTSRSNNTGATDHPDTIQPHLAPSNRAEAYVQATKHFQDLLIRLYKSILEYQIKAACHLSKSTLVRLARHLPKLDDWTNMQRNISRLDTECGHFEVVFAAIKSTSEMQSLQRILDEQEQRLADVIRKCDRKESDTRRLLASLSNVMVGQDHEDVRARLGHRYWGSGQWLINHPAYSIWKGSCSGAIWLRGPVGVGKTCLTSIIIQESLSRAVSDKVAFFYCSQQHGGAMVDSARFGSCEPITVLRSLLAQLSHGLDGNISSPVQRWLDCGSSGPSGTGEQPTPGYRSSMDRRISSSECVELLVETIEISGQTTLIVDALDECVDPYVLLDYLESVQKRAATVRIFLSSRLSVQSNLNFPQSYHVSQFDSIPDIEKFISTEISSPERRARSGMSQSQATQFQQILLS